MAPGCLLGDRDGWTPLALGNYSALGSGWIIRALIRLEQVMLARFRQRTGEFFAFGSIVVAFEFVLTSLNSYV